MRSRPPESSGSLAKSAKRPPASEAELTHAAVLAISLPIILSNISTPLLGVADTAVIGQLGEPHLIGAVALGSTVFSLFFWAFGFLRMGTTGLCAQADGAGNAAEVGAILARALLLAGAAGLLLIIFQLPLKMLCFYFIEASQEVEQELLTYFSIRIWSAPFTLANYAILGWFIGLGKTRIALLLQIALNGVNIALNILFVAGFEWGVAGIAIGTVAAEAGAALLGLLFGMRELQARGLSISWPRIMDRSALLRMLAVNTDLMIRTLCLLFTFTFFTAQAAKTGDLTLASNAILQQFLNVSAYLLDGFAFAAEVLTGRAIGAGDRDRFRQAIRLSTLWAACISLLISTIYFAAGGLIIDAMTTSPEVRETARHYLPWAAAAPVIGVACFQLDGIFIGATRTRDMRNMMLVTLALFLAAWAILMPAFGNHGLWAALMVFFAARALTLAAYFPALERDAFPATAAQRLPRGM